MFLRALASISGVMSTPMARPVGSDLARRDEHVETAAAAQVQHHLARLQRGQRRWVAARKAHVGALRQRRQLLRTVADVLGQLGRIPRHSSRNSSRRSSTKGLAARFRCNLPGPPRARPPRHWLSSSYSYLCFHHRHSRRHNSTGSRASTCLRRLPSAAIFPSSASALTAQRIASRAEAGASFPGSE